MQQHKRINQKKSAFKVINFFLLMVIFFNLVGNFVGISSEYTFYYFGLNSIAILSRYIENNIFDISVRIFVLGITTMASSALLFLLFHIGRKGKSFGIVIAIVLYILDFLLLYSSWYLEGAKSFAWSSFIHLGFLTLFLVSGLLYLLINPAGKKVNYGFTQ